ncbi:RhoGEF domain-containing protein [Heterostelium album PN500]|uniref:RhoGEF domain-containing protein n=1 Tax=Heterostelium pallidum (strain ATCC 26659 / Pp 5 / PN500) TaxID=670386 RepID=D3BKW7_HETP5|nr:RhoGEF domain-containing protein [Heterostelium album PN500]EFA78547.1 RhoGEF domain-containing protein [Heterostelium album PN500]|eukprot:XP_020430671.1 RhoGEF domain-containing protein [Heterostelium album PN500]
MDNNNLPPPPLLKTPPPLLPKSNSAGSLSPPNKSLPTPNKPPPLSKPPPLAKPPHLGGPQQTSPPSQLPPQQTPPLPPNVSGQPKPPNKLPPQPPAKLMTGTPTSTSTGSLPLPSQYQQQQQQPRQPPPVNLPPLPPSNMGVNQMPPPPPMPTNLPPPPPLNTAQMPPPPAMPTTLPPLPSSIANLPPPPMPTNLPPPPINTSGNSINAIPSTNISPTVIGKSQQAPPPILSPPPPLATPPLVPISNPNPMNSSTESFSPPPSNRNSVDLTALDFPEINTQNRIAEENFNYLKDIYTKITKRSQASSSTSREGHSLAEAFKNYGTMLIAQQDNIMGQCMFKVGDLHRDLETFRDRLDNQTLSGLRGTVDQYVNRDIKLVRASKKNFDKVRSLYDTIDGKCSANASKSKGINLVRQAELQQERDFLKGRVTSTGQESATTIRLVNESNSVEMMEQIIEYVESLQQASRLLTEQLDTMQPVLANYKKEAQKRKSELEKSIDLQKQLDRNSVGGNGANKDSRVNNSSDNIEREVQGEDPKRARVRRFISAERNYVSGLSTLVQVYLAGLRTDDRLFSKVFKEDEVAIFANIEPLLSHQTKFLEELEGCLKQYGEPGGPTLGQTFFKASGKFMSLYSVYVGNFSKALTTLNRVKQSKNFQAFLKTCEEKSDGADIDSLIPTPLTRITSYMIFLQDLKETDSSDPNEANSIRGALDKMQALGNLVGQSHNLIQLMKLQQSLIGFDASYLVEEGRFLLKEGTVSMSIGNAPVSSYYCILVSDLLIYCKKQTALFPSVLYDNTLAIASGSSSSNLGSNTKYKFVGKLEVKNMDLKTSPKDDEKTFVLTSGVGNNLVTVSVQFENKTIKEDWWSTISKAISKANQNKIFSIPLEHIYARPAEQGRAIPLFVQRILDYLYENAASEEGIFRLSANQRVLDASREEIETGVELDYSELDIHVVACLLKLWVRNLPEPLLTFKEFDSFVEIADIDSKRDKYIALKALVEKIPQINRFCTFYLMRMLTKVSDNCQVNKMTPNNVSIVFATLLLRKKGASPMDCTAFNSIFSLVECFMTGFHEIFIDIEKEYHRHQTEQSDAMKRRTMPPTKSLPGIPPTSSPMSLPSSPDNSPQPTRSAMNHHSRNNSSGGNGASNEDSDSDDDEGFSIGTNSKASITIQLGEIVKQGYLTKKGAMRRNWTKRWFVLKNGYLFYFKTSRDKKPKGIIQLVNVSVSKSYYKPYCMALKSSGSSDEREFLICATNQTELEEWIVSINKCSTKE